MRDLILKSLSSAIDAAVVVALVSSYERIVSDFRKGEIEPCLSNAGKFVEHTLRSIEHVRSGAAPTEIKSPAATVREIEKDSRLPESLRLLIPRIAYAMIYEVRSKRGAVHVKEIDPRRIDAALAVQAASWIIAELIRLYHTDSEHAVAQAMDSLVQRHVPLIEIFGDESVVTGDVPADIELLLLLARSAPTGLDRGELGRSSKSLPSTVTRTLQRLEKSRWVHRTRVGMFHITGPGARFLSNRLAQTGHLPNQI